MIAYLRADVLEHMHVFLYFSLITILLSSVCLPTTHIYRTYSRRNILNRVENMRWSTFAEIINVLKVVCYFRRRAPSWMFDRVLNVTLPNNLLKLEEGLRRSFTPLVLRKGILDFPCHLILLIYTNKKTNSSTK